MNDIVTKEMLETYRAKHWILEGELTFNTIAKRYWNYFGVHIRNPRRVPPKPKPEPKKEEPPVIANTPTPVQPKSKPEAPVLKVVTLRGTVIDAKTKKPIAAKISYVVPSEDNGRDSMQLSASSGKFKISLDAGNKYAYVAAAKGYFPASGAFDLTQAKVGEEVASEIVLNPVAVGESITLNNIYFDTGKYDLLPASSSELDRLVQLMRENVNISWRADHEHFRQLRLLRRRHAADTAG